MRWRPARVAEAAPQGTIIRKDDDDEEADFRWRARSRDRGERAKDDEREVASHARQAVLELVAQRLENIDRSLGEQDALRATEVTAALRKRWGVTKSRSNSTPTKPG